MSAMHHLTCTYRSDVSVTLTSNSIWKYSCGIVVLNMRRLETRKTTSGVYKGQYCGLKMNLEFYFFGECDGKLYNLQSVCE